ncbi:MAG: hypothetical protein R2702_17125 [Acidimicrobiales bacterium]
MRPPRPLLVLCALALSIGAAACGSAGSEPTPTTGEAAEPIELTRHGNCGEGWFWAANAEGSIAVTARVDGRDRATDEPTTWSFDEPDGEVTVELLRGDDLPRNFCTDVIDAGSQPRSTLAAVAVRGAIRMDPPGPTEGCGVEGELRIDELRGPDDERVAPFAYADDGIGCYSG